MTDARFPVVICAVRLRRLLDLAGLPCGEYGPRIAVLTQLHGPPFVRVKLRGAIPDSSRKPWTAQVYRLALAAGLEQVQRGRLTPTEQTVRELQQVVERVREGQARDRKSEARRASQVAMYGEEWA